MKVAFFNTKAYDRESFKAANRGDGPSIEFFEPRLNLKTVPLSKGFDAVCVFVNDSLNADVLEQLAANGTRIVALRCSGFNNVDLSAAEANGITVVRVPAYSPHAVAEHTAALILALNRQLHRAYNRVRENNFNLEGLLGFDIHGLTVGVVGTGKIGQNVVRILRGFGCDVLCFDPYPNEACREAGAAYVDLDALLESSRIISLHCPLTPDSYHMVNAPAIKRMRSGVMLINTSRGALIDTPAVIDGLKSGKIGSLGLDVYEEEGDLFFEDLSGTVIQDDVFARLNTFPNVLITGHQAFFTADALDAIAETTLANLRDLREGKTCPNTIAPADV